MPLPTEVRPTMNPPTMPIAIAANRSRHVHVEAVVVADHLPRLTKLFSTSPIAPKSSAAPRM